jgi:putative SOS response-associated peptidase YedK
MTIDTHLTQLLWPSSNRPHWRVWLTPPHRCVVPFTSFCEYADTKPRETPTWFAFNQERPLAFFAGIWAGWHGRRGTRSNPVDGEHQLVGFLTTAANAEVGAIHPKAMPVILTDRDRIETWLTAPAVSCNDRYPTAAAKSSRVAKRRIARQPNCRWPRQSSCRSLSGPYEVESVGSPQQLLQMRGTPSGSAFGELR